MNAWNEKSDIVIAGGGLAGIVAALEALNAGYSVTLVDRDGRENFGGLAKRAFGGMALVNTPMQRFFGIHDSPDLAFSDWMNCAELGSGDTWPRNWAKYYVHQCLPDVYFWLKSLGIGFIPSVNWVERGQFGAGNSVPRYHIIWGTGHSLCENLIQRLHHHHRNNQLKLLFKHRVTQLSVEAGRVNGLCGMSELDGSEFSVSASTVIVAAGGINGNIDRVKDHWDRSWGAPPETILNGSHKFADGKLHDLVEGVGGAVTHLENMWNYPSGIQDPKPDMPDHGLSLLPPRSALWIDCRGRRIGPQPMVSGFDTRDLCKRVCQQERQYTWQVMNWKIALKELAISGAEHNPMIRDKNIVGFAKDLIFGNSRLVNWMIDHCKDVVVGQSLPELVDKMNGLTQRNPVNLGLLQKTIADYDCQIDRGPRLFNDEQLRQIAHLRRWPADRIRTCKFQKIMDNKAMPLIAIREFILSRKSLGGIQTDLQSRVMDCQGQAIPGLYAIGEAAGFGGGGVNGKRSLEGTFMSLCILNAKAAIASLKTGG